MSKTKLQDESKRKFLKYTALAALGIGAGYALSQATGADRMALAASPIETGWVLDNEIAIAWKDTGGTVRNALYLDGSNNLQIGGTGITDVIVNNPATFPALGIVLSGAGTGVGTMTYANSATSGTLTFPAVNDTLAVLGTAQTFTAAQTFNGGIVFDAAGSIASTSTFIEADGAGGDMNVNVPTGKNLTVKVGGTAVLSIQGGNNGYLQLSGSVLFPATDTGLSLGASGNRFSSVTSDLFNVYHASRASFPTAQLADGALNLGIGTAATDTQINRAAAGVVGLPGFKTAAGGTAPTTVSLTSGTAYTPSTTQNTVITIGGGTVTAIAINGTTTGLTSGTFYLKANDTITVTFSAAPTALQMVA